MVTKTIPLLVSNYNKLTAKDSGCQRLLNWYLEERPDYVSGNNKISCYRTPGYSLWKDMSGSFIRGMFVHLDYLYVVKDSGVYKVATDKTSTLLGSMSSSGGRVFICALNDEILISDYTEAWSYKITANTWAQITDLDLPTPIGAIDSLANRVIYCIKNTQTYFASDLEDGRAITATTNATTSLKSDDLISLTTSLNNVYFFGDTSTEVWAPYADVVVPYDRVSGGLLPFGITSPYLFAEVLGSLYVIAKDKDGIIGVVKIDGLNSTIIKNDDFVEKVNTYINTTDAFCWTFSDKGHHFLAITFPVSETVIRGRTWILDVATQAWAELESNDPVNAYSGFLNRHTANCCVQFNGLQLIGDFQSGKIYEFSSDYYDEDGSVIRRKIVGPHIKFDNNKLTMSNIVVDVEGGIGDVDGGIYDDPTIYMSYSIDGGHTFTDPNPRSCGGSGQYLINPGWSSAGSGRIFTFMIDVSDPVDWAIHDMYAKLSVAKT